MVGQLWMINWDVEGNNRDLLSGSGRVREREKLNVQVTCL
jgi:hypothetical protein